MRQLLAGCLHGSERIKADHFWSLSPLQFLTHKLNAVYLSLCFITSTTRKASSKCAYAWIAFFFAWFLGGASHWPFKHGVLCRSVFSVKKTLDFWAKLRYGVAVSASLLKLKLTDRRYIVRPIQTELSWTCRNKVEKYRNKEQQFIVACGVEYGT